MDNRYKDNFLFFDEGPHKYTDTLGNEYRSVTTLIGDYYNHFDADYWAHKKAKEQGKSEKQIRAEWDRIKEIYKQANMEGVNKTLHDKVQNPENSQNNEG